MEAGRKQNMAPMWKKLMKLVDVGEPTSFLDHVFFWCTQRDCKSNEHIIWRIPKEQLLRAGKQKDRSKSHGFHIQTARVRRTSSWCNFCLYPGTIGRCSQTFENSKSVCPDIWIRLPRHKWPKSWSSMEDPVVPLERNLYGHHLTGLLWERQFE